MIRKPGRDAGLAGSRRTALAMAMLALAWTLPAAAQECPVEDPGCAAGGPCPLRALPYEEFIASPPLARQGRGIPAVAERPLDPDSGPRVLVKGFVVDGVSDNPETGVTQQSANEAAHAAFMAFSSGAPEALMTVGQVVRIADAVTTFYRGKGYVVARAFVPVQTIGADGIVHLQVLEGTISEVVVEGNKSYSANVLRRAARPLVGRTPVRDEVETALLYSQDYPGVRLFGTFRPGDAAGETKLVLQVLEEEHFGFKFGADNYGSEFTGIYRVRGDVAWYNPVGLADRLDLTLLQSAAPENTTYGSLRYAVPLGIRGLGMYVLGSQNAFQITEDPFTILQLKGSITTYEGGFEWRHGRSRFLNQTLVLSYARKASELEAVGGAVKVSDDTINVGVLESSLEHVDTRFKGLNLATFRVRKGLGAELSGSASTVDPDFLAYELRYSRLQALGDTQFMLLRLRAQQVDSRLSPIEQFALAGPDAVRAYPVGEILRDVGRLVSLEYRVQAPGFARAAGPFGRQWGDVLQVSTFVDYAQGENAEFTSTAGKASDDISGYGLGIQFGVQRSFQFLLQGAKPLGNREAVDGKEFRVYGELSVEF
jgi:hemolysin activation/secretion protein